MPGWRLVDTHPTHGRTYTRPLDALEQCYLWDGFFDGTSDAVHHYQLRLANTAARDARHGLLLFSDANVMRAWVSTKRRFPLAGASVRGSADPNDDPLEVASTDSDATTSDVTGVHGHHHTGFTSEPHFVVRERDLARCRPEEVVFGTVVNAEEAQRRAAAIVRHCASDCDHADGSGRGRALSEALLVQLHIWHETGVERKDSDSDLDASLREVLHVVMVVAHCVADATASRTLARCLLDTLARGLDSNSPEPAQMPLEERLAMAVPPFEVVPARLRALEPGIRRWRRAVGIVIFQSREAKRQGGHTLPCRLTRDTPHVPARPALLSTSLTPAHTATALACSRRHDITFGNALLALAQVAMTRVLYRRYLRGDMSEEEWAYRTRQPHINGGPLSLRRFLDPAWVDAGGGGEVVLAISLYMYQLPFMTLGSGSMAARDRARSVRWSDGAPPFSELLTVERFVYRARLVKRQAMAFFGHPLFLEILQASHEAYLTFTRWRALRWRAETVDGHAEDGYDREDSDGILAVTDMPGTVWAHGGSSLGNLDLMSPSEYPLSPAHPLSPYSPVRHPTKAGYVVPCSPSPPPLSVLKDETTTTVVVEDAKTYFHTRPAELYLGAATSRGRMTVYVQYDGNVFEEDVVREWLDEVRGAVVWYLCQT